MYHTDRDGIGFTLWLQAAIEAKLESHFTKQIMEVEAPNGLEENHYVRITFYFIGTNVNVNWHIVDGKTVAARRIKSGKFTLDSLEAVAIALNDYL